MATAGRLQVMREFAFVSLANEDVLGSTSERDIEAESFGYD